MQAQANRRVLEMDELVTVAQLEAEMPVSPVLAAQVAKWTKIIEDILMGIDPRIMVLVGPCSIHDPVAAMKFAAHVRDAQRRFGDKLFLVMRTFFAKPRTLITGPEHWTGLINDPLRDGSFDMTLGARMARQLAMAITSMGVPIGTEIMNFSQANLFDELVSWAGVGARSVEFQEMRQVGSAWCTSIAFKNGTAGNLDIAINAILTARARQTFSGPNKHGVMCKITGEGNPFAHLVLRGGADGPNFGSEHVDLAKQALDRAGIDIGIGVDCSHGNSGKDPKKQKLVVQDLAGQIKAGERRIKLVGLESNLMGGRQDHWGKSDEELRHGLSITDGCESFGDSLRNMEVLADALG